MHCLVSALCLQGLPAFRVGRVLVLSQYIFRQSKLKIEGVAAMSEVHVGQGRSPSNGLMSRENFNNTPCLCFFCPLADVLAARGREGSV